MSAQKLDGDPDLLSAEAIDDPHTFYGRLRENDPAHWNERHRSWVLTRYADVTAAFTDTRLSSDRVQPVFDTKLNAAEQAQRGPTFEVLADWMVFTDPPDHTRLRGLVQHAFSPRTIERMAPRIGEIVDSVLDIPEAGEVDVVRQIAYPIPAMVIAEMLGVPPADRDRFRVWSNAISVLVFGGAANAGDRDRAQDGLLALREYLHHLLDRYRSDPADNVMSDLLRAHLDRDALSGDEVVHTCILLLFAGHETTTNLIANSFVALAENPAQHEALRASPQHVARAVEELNRFDPPARIMVRRAVEDVDLHGRTIRAGDRVLLCQSSANRDPRQFEDPDKLDLRREQNRHASFGFGIHYCLGASLARLEAQAVLPKLVDRLRDPVLPDVREWLPLVLTRGLRTLPVRYGN